MEDNFGDVDCNRNRELLRDENDANNYRHFSFRQGTQYLWQPFNVALSATLFAKWSIQIRVISAITAHRMLALDSIL